MRPDFRVGIPTEDATWWKVVFNTLFDGQSGGVAFVLCELPIDGHTRPDVRTKCYLSPQDRPRIGEAGVEVHHYMGPKELSYLSVNHKHGLTSLNGPINISWFQNDASIYAKTEHGWVVFTPESISDEEWNLWYLAYSAQSDYGLRPLFIQKAEAFNKARSK